MELTHQTFTIDIRHPISYSLQLHEEIETLVKDTYDIEEYLIAFEPKNDKQEDKPHFHFIVYTDYKNCTNLLQKLVKDYNLASKGGKRGGKRYYARLKKPIRDLNKLKIYCSKDNNIKSSYTNETLDDLYRQSFKVDLITRRDKVLKHIEEVMPSHHRLNPHRVKIAIIQYYKENKLLIRKTLIDSDYMWVRQNSEISGLMSDSKQIYRELYPFDFNDFY